MTASPDVVAFLVRAARELAGARAVFTGFHWPMLAARLARRLEGGDFAQVLEPGGVSNADTPALPTSTSDFSAFRGALCWMGSTSDVLQSLVRRVDRVVLDAANVDLSGQVNSTAIGDLTAPAVRLPGGGGSADVAAAARDLVLLHGGSAPRRVQRRVDHATARPRPGAVVRLIGRFGVLALGERPRLLERASGEVADAFVAWFARLGVEVSEAELMTPPTEREAGLAAAVLQEASERGYVAAERALEVTAR